MASYLASYRPLAITKRGRLAAHRLGIPPFVDGSCRREPDLQSDRPSITALCRAHMFAPRLQRNDEVAYITVKSTFGERCEGHYRLVAHLKVFDLSAFYEEVVDWYRTHALEIPSNCMVSGSRPIAYEGTNGRNDGRYRGMPEDVKLHFWDGEYRKRARRIGCFVHCQPLFVELYTPPSAIRPGLRRNLRACAWHSHASRAALSRGPSAR